MLLILPALCYAQKMNNRVMPPQQRIEKSMHDENPGMKRLPDAAKVRAGIIRGEKPAAEEGYYLPSLVTYFTQTDSGIIKTRNSKEYDLNGNQVSGISQIDAGNGWVNSIKDTSYLVEKNDTVEYIWETFYWADTVWVPEFRSIYAYYSGNSSDSGLLRNLYRSYESLSEGGEKNVYEYSYDDNGNLIQQIILSGVGDSVEPEERETYQYDSQNRRIMYKLDNWNEGVWMPSYRGVSLYDDQGHPAMETYEVFVDPEWVIQSQFNYIWDSEGNLLSSLLKYRSGGMLVNTDSVAYEYDKDSSKINTVTFIWINAAWTYYSKEVEVYTESNYRLYSEIQLWKDSVWSNKNQEFYEYDAKGNLLSYISKIGENDTGWVNMVKTVYTYDDNNNPVSGENFVWTNMTWVQGNGYLYDGSSSIEGYYFEAEFVYIRPQISAEDENLQPSNFSLSQNYPNPFNPETKISFSLPQSGKTMLKIYDMLGREVAELINGEMEKGPHLVNFSGRNLSSGVYIYRLQSGSFTESKKMMLIK
jgi:hypothetical protein